jgi:hypothetical protein
MPEPNHSALTDAQLELLLNRAAEKGARKALADVGLDGDYAESDIRDLRTLLRAINLAKKTAWQTFIRLLTAGIFTALMAGIAIKLKLFGGQ